jgi:hypothetical protein
MPRGAVGRLRQAGGHLPVKDQRRHDRVVSAQDDGLPFVLNVQTAFHLTGRGTVITGVVEQGVLHIGDHLELTQPSGADTAQPLRFQCLGFDAAPRVTDRDPALGYPVAIFVGPGVEPNVIQAGAKLRAVA